LVPVKPRTLAVDPLILAAEARTLALEVRTSAVAVRMFSVDEWRFPAEAPMPRVGRRMPAVEE